MNRYPSKNFLSGEHELEMVVLKRILLAAIVATALCAVSGAKGRKAKTPTAKRADKMRAALAAKRAGGKKQRAPPSAPRPGFAKGSQKTEAAQQKVVLKAQQTAAYNELLDYCRENSVGAKAALKANPELGEIKGVNYQGLERRLVGTVKNGEEHDGNRILTDLEETDLVDFLVLSNLGRDGKNVEEIGVLVQSILKVRRAQNRRGGRAFVPFSGPALKIVMGDMPSQSFYRGFFARHHEALSKKVNQPVEAHRARVSNDATVEEHFEGCWGLRAELQDAGIMADDGTILDASRILNRDETPQFIDYASDKGNAKTKVAAGKHDPAIRVDAENRQCESVDMTWGADGFQYGLHLILKRKTISVDLIDEDLAAEFDDEIFEKFMYSSHGLISTTAEGVQTGVSVLAAYKMLDAELTKRGVERPVVMMTDNHASRKAEDVLAFCEEARPRVPAVPGVARATGTRARWIQCKLHLFMCIHCEF